MKTVTFWPFEKEFSDLDSYPVTVLLVDDQQIVAESIKRALASEKDIEFHYCQDPTKAIKVAQDVGPTVILLDLLMPEIDGLTLLRFFRANPRTRHIPIVVLSSKEEPEIKSEAFAKGANDYLVKLPDKIELIARIRYHSRAYINQIQRDRAFEALKRLSIQDGLTGIANRRRFNDFLESELKRAKRNQQPISLIIADIDFFKRFNDTYGHHRGDQCLVAVAGALKKALQRPADLVARYGGEEFGVVLPETDQDGALEVARKMHKNVADLRIPHPSSEVADHVTISLGLVSTIPSKNLTTDALIQAADKALYKAKSQGRNQVAIGSLDEAFTL